MPATWKTIADRRFAIGVIVAAVLAITVEPFAVSVGAQIAKVAVPVRKPIRQLDMDVLTGFRFVELVDPELKVSAESHEFFEGRFIPTDADIRDSAVAYLLVHYYTSDGSPPKVPHTPEICYGQAGNQVTEMGSTSIPLDLPGSGAVDVAAKYVRMTNPNEPDNKDICVMYVFCVNGEFLDDREKARLILALPWNRAEYFAKIECVTNVPGPDRLDDAIKANARMLSHVIPELLDKHFPTQQMLLDHAARPAEAAPRNEEG